MLPGNLPNLSNKLPNLTQHPDPTRPADLELYQVKNLIVPKSSALDADYNREILEYDLFIGQWPCIVRPAYIACLFQILLGINHEIIKRITCIGQEGVCFKVSLIPEAKQYLSSLLALTRTVRFCLLRDLKEELYLVTGLTPRGIDFLNNRPSTNPPAFLWREYLPTKPITIEPPRTEAKSASSVEQILFFQSSQDDKSTKKAPPSQPIEYNY